MAYFHPKGGKKKLNVHFFKKLAPDMGKRTRGEGRGRVCVIMLKEIIFQ